MNVPIWMRRGLALLAVATLGLGTAACGEDDEAGGGADAELDTDLGGEVDAEMEEEE